jgi:hypothetical protein
MSAPSAGQYLLALLTMIICEIRATLPGKSTAATKSKDLFDVGGNRRARKKPPIRDPCRKSLFNGATYLVPRAGIQPTQRLATGLKFRHVRRTEPLGHFT